MIDDRLIKRYGAIIGSGKIPVGATVDVARRVVVFTIDEKETEEVDMSEFTTDEIQASLDLLNRFVSLVRRRWN